MHATMVDQLSVYLARNALSSEPYAVGTSAHCRGSGQAVSSSAAAQHFVHKHAVPVTWKVHITSMDVEQPHRVRSTGMYCTVAI